MKRDGTPSRAEATEGVDQRLMATLHAYPGLRLVAVPAQFLRLPEAAAAGDGARVLRGGHLPELDASAGEFFDAVADLWRGAGCTVEQHSGLDGRLVIVRDPAGYLLTLSAYGEDDPILIVASPPAASQFADRSLFAGLLSGLGLGCLGPCVGTVLPMAAIPSLAGLSAPYWAWVPLYLMVGLGTLWLPETRKFGAGVLISGAVIGITVAGVFSS